MVQNQIRQGEIEKRPLGSRQGLMRAQRLNAELREKRLAAVEQKHGPKVVDVAGSAAPTQAKPKRPVARTEFEQRVLEQRRERAEARRHGGQVMQPQVVPRVQSAGHAAVRRVAEHPAESAPVRRAAGRMTDPQMRRVAKRRPMPGVRLQATRTQITAETEVVEAPAPAPARPASTKLRRATPVASRVRRAERPLKRPVMTPEIKQRPLGQPRSAAGLTVGDMVADYQDYDPSEPNLPNDPELVEEPVQEPPKKRSPFLESVKVEKRPLSRRLAADEDIPGEIFDDFPENDPELEPPASEPEPRKRSVLPLIGLLSLTVVLGAVVGAVVYLCIFQQF